MEDGSAVLFPYLGIYREDGSAVLFPYLGIYREDGSAVLSPGHEGVSSR